MSNKTRVHAKASFTTGSFYAATVIVKEGESIKAATERVMKKVQAIERKYQRKDDAPRKATYEVAITE